MLYILRNEPINFIKTEEGKPEKLKILVWLNYEIGRGWIHFVLGT